MSKTNDHSLIGEFISMAAQAQDPHAKHRCQSYFLQNLVGESDTREAKQKAFLSAAGNVACIFDSEARKQTPDNYDAIMARIPESETGVRHALRKVALNLGIINAPGWGCSK